MADDRTARAPAHVRAWLATPAAHRLLAEAAIVVLAENGGYAELHEVMRMVEDAYRRAYGGEHA